MDESQLMLPTVDEYVRAFEAADAAGKITPKQRKMLIFHHSQSARAVSARTLAESVGFANYNAANLQYGKLGGTITEALGGDYGDTEVGVLVDFVYPNQAANAEFLWVMRERVAIALEEIGWVPRVSTWLYPHKALTRQRSE